MLEFIDHPDLQEFSTDFAPGEIVFLEGDESRSIYILVSGTLDVLKGEKKISEINEPGTLFGEMSFLLQTKRTATVRCCDEVQALCIPSSRVAELWNRFTDIAIELTRVLAHRLYETTNVAHALSSFCDQLPDAMIVTDRNRHIISWNRAAEKLYGYSWNKVRNRPIEDVYEDQASFRRFMDDLLSLKSIREKKLKVNHPSETWKFVSTSTTVLYDAHDQVQGFLFLGRDITEHHRLVEKHKLFKKLLIPALVILSFLVVFQTFRMDRQPDPMVADNLRKMEARLQNNFENFLNHSFLALNLAVSPALEKGESRNVGRVLQEYFALENPSKYGITGIILLDRHKKVFAHETVHGSKSPGVEFAQPYSGSLFLADKNSRNQSFQIYLVSRTSSEDDKGVEVAFPLNRADRTIGWILFQLKMQDIENKFGYDIRTLAEMNL